MNTKRILALVLALLMVFSLTACGGNGEEVIEEEVQIEYVSGEQTGNEQQPGNNQQTNNNQPTNNNQQTNNNQPTNGVDVSKLKGTTVRYATWKDPEYNEDGVVIDSFKEQYGIDVKIDLINEGEYIKKISSLIGSGQDIPDVFFCNETFPSCLKCLQPIAAAKIDFSDPIWDKTFNEYFTIDGDTYLVNTVSNIWNETDILFYNKNVLRAAGYSDPDNYIKTLVDQGKWTFDALTTMMRTIKSKGYKPNFMAQQPIVCSTGANWLKYSNGEFSHGFDSTLYDAVKQVASWKQEGLVSTNFKDMGDYFTTDQMGFCITQIFGLKTTGYFGGIVGKKMDPNNVGFTYIPDMSASHKAVSSGKTRGYGLIRGASNPLGAGVFLRYYLDVNNYDTGSAFISKKAEDFFFEVTTPERFSKTNFYNLEGLGISGATASAYTFLDYAPTQVETAMQAAIPTFKNMADTLNKNINTDLSSR